MKKGSIKLDSERCKGCGLCVSVCPNGRLKISKQLNKMGYYPIEYEYDDGKKVCTCCTICAIVCPDIAIEVYCD